MRRVARAHIEQRRSIHISAKLVLKLKPGRFAIIKHCMEASEPHCFGAA
jgi:hypothetical protein